MSKIIKFTKIFDISDAYIPKPTSTFLPEWYKKTNSYVGGQKDLTQRLETNATIKKCIPVFDVLTAGYIIPTYCDLMIKKDQDGNINYIPTIKDFSPIQFHSTIQAPYNPRMNGHDYPKWINPFSIETPPGYSCLFLPPVHKGNNFFTIMEGFVDTDNYSAPVNFPFVLNDINFEGIIPAGTPMVQVIPIKRDSWKAEYSDKNNNKAIEVMKKLNSIFYDRYKNLFWNKKEYR